ncbi:MAG: TonB-dependent receptor [Bacteroidetes bacterium]|jgi:hypothetical protein|nr:TonB-dependent receptor [Bacteroidota bacterium]
MKTEHKVKHTLSAVFFLLFLIFHAPSIQAQQDVLITGVVTDSDENVPLPFAHVVLLDSTETNMIEGTVSDIEGIFSLRFTDSGNFTLRISAIGYESYYKQIDAGAKGTIELGEIPLSFALIMHESITVMGEVTARPSADRTSYYVNENLVSASTSGTDLLKFIPGIDVDIMQNISLEGSRNIIIFVDGKERDRSFLSQLHSSQIDRVDILNMPPASFDASVTGALNIVLNKQPEYSLSGHLNVDVPTTHSEKYLFPAYSVNYGRGKLNLFTSYNGEFSYFDVTEKLERSAFETEWNSVQNVRQQYWSHKFHYGLDYAINSSHELGFYGWYNPYSQENSGTAETKMYGEQSSLWSSDKIDDDSNRSEFYSVFYKYQPGGKNGRKLSFDAARQTLKTTNSVTYINHQAGDNIQNLMKLNQQIHRFRADYRQPLTDRLVLEGGLQAKTMRMSDEEISDFEYRNENVAGYGSFTYNSSKIELQSGMRVESASYGVQMSDQNHHVALFPNASIRYRIPETSQSVRFSYRRSVQYPHLYQLNPSQNFDDPYSSSRGNPGLNPSFQKDLNLEYSLLFGNSFLTAGLFYSRQTDAIHTFTDFRPNGVYELKWLNLGDVEQKGVRLSGSINLGSRSGFQPFFSLFELRTSSNGLVAANGVRSNRALAYDSGLTAYTGFGKGFTASAQFQYSSPQVKIQRSVFSDALYFISIEKSFSNGLKAGIITGLPFSRSFTYEGNKINATDFQSRSEGIINMSSVPFWFRINYQFSRGTGKSRAGRDNSIAPRIPRKGF